MMRKARHSRKVRWLAFLAVLLAAASTRATMPAPPANADGITDISAGSYDLIVSKASYTYLPANTFSTYPAGWYLLITVKNTSPFNVNESFKVAVKSQLGGVLKTYTLGGLAAGAAKTIPHPMPACSPNAWMQLQLVADSSNDVIEGKETNNTLWWTHVCGP